jgi:UDP-N-acetylglucosamine 2-epimerase
MPKIVTIVGARPQFIKAAVVSRAIREHNEKLASTLSPSAISPSPLLEVIIHTGQHYDANMSDVFFQELGIPHPDYNLGIGSGNHGEQTGKMLVEIEKVLLRERPDMVMVYGDTNSTLAGALAASKLHIPVAHVEAGLRSYNKNMPEEINRTLTDHVSSILFCPTETAVRNLKKEGFTNIVNNGTLIDAPISHLPLALSHPPSPLTDPDASFAESNMSPCSSHFTSDASLFTDFDAPLALSHPLVVNVGDVMFDLALQIKENVNESSVLKKYNLKPNEFILVTIHRAENTDNESNLRNVWEALIELTEGGKPIFFPAHPRTIKALRDHGLLEGNLPDRIILNVPVPYGEIIALESTARLVITDSGGVQKESYFFQTSCAISRKESEWVELIESGWAVLTGADRQRIVESASLLWERKPSRDWKAFYGDGKASQRICAQVMGTIICK